MAETSEKRFSWQAIIEWPDYNPETEAQIREFALKQGVEVQFLSPSDQAIDRMKQVSADAGRRFDEASERAAEAIAEADRALDRAR